MKGKEKELLKKILDINAFVLDNLSAENFDKILVAFGRFESDLRRTIRETEPEKAQVPIWQRFSSMTEEEIRREFNDVAKYPDLDSIKSAVQGYVDMGKVTKVKTRNTLIKHIINTYRRGEFISKIGKEADESK